MAFVGNMNIHLYAYPLVWLGSFFLLHIPWPDQDPSFNLTRILFWLDRDPLLFSLLLLLFLLFPSFWDFGPSWSFLASWIGFSFVKAHGLSLLFMKWTFLWNFGPQQGSKHSLYTKWNFNMRRSITPTHNHNCLMGTITFKVHHITLTSPRNTLATILKAFWFFLVFMFFE